MARWKVLYDDMQHAELPLASQYLLSPHRHLHRYNSHHITRSPVSEDPEGYQDQYGPWSWSDATKRTESVVPLLSASAIASARARPYHRPMVPRFCTDAVLSAQEAICQPSAHSDALNRPSIPISHSPASDWAVSATALHWGGLTMTPVCGKGWSGPQTFPLASAPTPWVKNAI